MVSVHLNPIKQLNPVAVPVIAIFTKFDAMISEAYRILRETSEDIRQCKKDAPAQAHNDFTTNYLPRIEAALHPPKKHIYLQGMYASATSNIIHNQVLVIDMNKMGSSCEGLVELTADALDSEALCQLFIMMQQTRVELKIKWVIRR
jgi:serine/threonine-protein kinase TNNI3K